MRILGHHILFTSPILAMLILIIIRFPMKYYLFFVV
jgi:hypothetical protein